MRQLVFRCTPVVALLFVAACTSESPTSTVAADVRTPAMTVSAEDAGTYLVRFKGNGVPDGFNAQIAALGGQVIFAHRVGVAAVAGLSATAADQLAAASSIAGVDPDYVTVLDNPGSMSVESESAPQSPAAPATALRFSRQWNMKTIQADVAWAAGKIGSDAVKVGIIDTGIDYLHPDLVGRVDLTLSRSFLSDAENARVTNTFGAGTPLWVDLYYHGSHVAATVASNAYIYAGVTSMTKLVALRVCTPGTSPAFRASCPTSAVLSAILYATDNNIPIVNMSLGGAFNRRDASARGGFGPSFIATINQIMSYANRNGTTVVVSAGNSAADLDHDGNGFTAYCSASNVLCASATGPTGAAGLNGPWANIDAFAGYSNYGRSAISVAAPGGNAVAVTAACSGFTVVTALLVCRNRFFISPTNFSAFSVGISGTSMASPHVAGVAALIAANGILQPAQIRAIIQKSADDLGQPGVDPFYGSGRVNAARAAGAI
ncbi:MAG: S8 family serine peptidase [Gemmatimonadales bacterium]